MTNKAELKKSISSAIKVGNLAIAFEQLLTLPHHEVATLLSKNNWLKEKPTSNFFWGEFCLNNFEMVFSSVAQETILNWYLGNPESSNRNLNSMLSTKYPATFIKAIKRNRSFINNDLFTELLDLPWGAEHSADILAWGELHKAFNAYQTEMTDSWLKIEDKSIEVILSGIIYWIDVRFYEDNSPLNQEKLRWVYNFAVNYLFSKKEIVDPKTEEQFDEIFFKTIHSSMVNGIDRFLMVISDWIEFETTILSSYCFDDNFQATLKDGMLYFDFKSNEKYEEWRKGTERYLVNAKRYFVDALQIYKYQDEKGELNIPKGNSEIDEAINHHIYIKNWQSTLFLEDLMIRNLKFHGRATHFSKFLGGLIPYAVNRKKRYEEPMRSFISQGISWNESLLQTMKEAENDNVSNMPFPYVYESVEQLIMLYKYAFPELTELEIQDLINHFSYSIHSGNIINPFQLKYSVQETPFLRLGNYVISPTSLFATNDWFYSLGQMALSKYANRTHENERQETASLMEIELGKMFKEHEWKSMVISEQEASKIDGDIDIFVNDGNSQLLIQLKRTKFKLDLASDYKDSLETDLKASGQLNEAVRMLEANPLQGMEILNNHERWIITTSFEGVLSRVDGCLKVNYFDLLWALRYKKFDSLDELKEYIEADKPFKDCRYYLEL
ncbi:hypothetical protein H9Y05_06815 [Crocinitomicaceae bacterium CZZ-1]|uniref:Uncharacterized protein n=1 Tax=Taishania pollutisoli TaxID=2766479 RepID=A0A8J6TZJ0_9FLAO|nr:hypothetical protein [Taishania pollutisoli]MBC9812188.1 hypothetical protein [Taishania pollutisoli]